MDHAPLSQSSKRPCEDNDIEGLPWELELPGLADLIANSVGKPGWACSSGFDDEAHIRVDGRHMRAQTSKAETQTTIAAANLEHLLAAPGSNTPQCSKLVLLGINAKGHARIPFYVELRASRRLAASS
jgi:hypothetical protein